MLNVKISRVSRSTFLIFRILRHQFLKVALGSHTPIGNVQTSPLLSSSLMILKYSSLSFVFIEREICRSRSLVQASGWNHRIEVLTPTIARRRESVGANIVPSTSEPKTTFALQGWEDSSRRRAHRGARNRNGRSLKNIIPDSLITPLQGTYVRRWRNEPLMINRYRVNRRETKLNEFDLSRVF